MLPNGNPFHSLVIISSAAIKIDAVPAIWTIVERDSCRLRLLYIR
jgi:hypothetical protein